MLSKADIVKIITDLNAPGGAVEKIKALQKAVEVQTDTSIKPEYRAPQIGKTSIIFCKMLISCVCSDLCQAVFKGFGGVQGWEDDFQHHLQDGQP